MSIEWKLAEEAEEAKRQLEHEEDFTASTFGGGDGFWYDITDGGYFIPEEALSDKQQIEAVKSAVELLRDLESNVYSKIVPEF